MRRISSMLYPIVLMQRRLLPGDLDALRAETEY